ncbi:hypothetical protein AB0395_21760 [Streptosporangium sp. NPDC051023]|uniref:hypothetical protein n=1 Tax=Streptosporangium sp. NPDC051023 TaxID=3155410 RepID=UPI00344F57BF
MALINPPAYLQAGSYAARLDRLAQASLLVPSHGVGALAVRGGVRPTPSNTGLQVTQRSTPAMFVTIAAGTAYIQAQSATGGAYIVHNDASVDVAVTAAHATLARKDLVIARIYDAEVSGASNTSTLEVVTGTPAASPTLPATPSGAIALAQVQVGAAVSTITNAAITDLRIYTTSLGGTIPALSTAMPATPYEGMAAYQTDTNKPVWHNGSTWHSWSDEGYLTSSGVAIYLSSNGYIPQSSFLAAGYQPTTYIQKAADTSRTNTVTLTDDPHLTTTVPAVGLWWINAFIIYAADAGVDIQIGFTGPAGASMRWVSELLTTSATTGVDTISRSAQTLANVPTGGGRGVGTANWLVAPITGYLQTQGTGGTFAVRWAPNVSSALATSVYAGSLLVLRQMA